MSETIHSSESPKPDPALTPEGTHVSDAEGRLNADAGANSGTRRLRLASAVAGLLVVIILLAIGGGIYAFRQHAAQNPQIAALDARIAAMDGQIGTLKAQTARLAAQQAAPRPPAEIKLPASVTAKIDGLQQNVTALSSKIDGLQQNTAALSSKIDGLQQNTTALAATVTADHTALAGVQSNVANLQSGLASVQSSLGNMPKLAAKARRMDQIAVASLALQTGEPLGAIPGAPPALARFATANPPTEAALRLAFPDAARKAAVAGGDVQASGGFWDQVKMRAENLVTVRRGSDVLVGSRAEGVLAAAQRDLDAGDLRGAVAALNTLPPPAKAAMQGWIDQAAALVAARQALIAIAEQH